MSLITASDLTKAYGAQDVFSNISLALPHRARVAIVGPNGVGKTTLLRVMAGLEKPDGGQIHRARDLRIGYLPQEATFSHSQKRMLDSDLWSLCLGAFDELRAMEARVQQLENDMADPSRVDRAMEQYGTLQEKFELAGGYTYAYRMRAVLNGLGFEEADWPRPMEQFSGGERTRALLARLLLEDPDLLMLDEPTNHLDIQAVEWLETWLRDWAGAVIVVSHDRYFLDRVSEAVWELSPGRLESYRGNYSQYVQQRADRLALLEKQYQAQEEMIQKERDYIQRNIAGQNTRQAQGRRKRLERYLRDDAIQLPGRQRNVKVTFEDGGRSGDKVLETKNLQIGHPDQDQPLFASPDLLLERGDVTALIGPNGAGKTTFLRTVLGELPPKSGQVKLGASLKVGYFAQAHKDLLPERTVLQEIMSVDPDLRSAEARDFLALFLFQGEEVFKPIEILSGGERGRIALAKLVLEGANLLLLDEPTNHLDIPSQEALQEALSEYPGTILLVSHDRYLIDGLANKIWAISPDSAELTVHENGYQAYLETRRLSQEQERQSRRSSRPAPTPGPDVGREFSPRQLAQLEDRITQLESRLAEIGQELQTAGQDADQIRRLGQEYARLEEQLEEAMQQWELMSKGELPA
jgi:ATP-binding cassette subfamily F protein 3